jgi:transposase
MQFFQGYLYALRLKAQKEALLRRWAGCRRWVWNEALAFQRAELEAGRRRPTYGELSARLPILKREHPWLADPPSQALQQTLKDLCEAWDKHRTVAPARPALRLAARVNHCASCRTWSMTPPAAASACRSSALCA